MIYDSTFNNRISQHLLEQMSLTADPSGYTDRNVREAIRILEGLPAAPSSFGMKHKERAMKGVLAGYWHVHIPESLLSRTYNNIGRDKTDIKTAPTQNETTQKGVKASLVRVALSRSITCDNMSIEEIIDELYAYAGRKKIPAELIENEIKSASAMIFDKSLFGRDFATGDWLMFSKDVQGNRLYLDVTPHIDAQDNASQESLKLHLDRVLLSFANT